MKTKWSSRACSPLACAALSLLFVGCNHGSSRKVVPGSGSAGALAGDFQSIADYLNDATVMTILARMPRNAGSTPPDVEGEYNASGKITSSTIRGTNVGDAVLADFCFGPSTGARLDVLNKDPSVADAGASSFIEGSGDLFTVYTAFKSVQSQQSGSSCEIHLVNIYSGARNADGSLSDLFIGVGVVGLVGNCSGLLVGQYQISRNIADLVGPSCTGGSPGSGPQDPRNVLATVENHLVTQLLVFLDNDPAPTLTIDPSSVQAFEAAPGFAIFFQSVQPSAGQDAQGADLLMGEIVSGQFAADTTAAGGTVTYSIENQVGDGSFFAPLPVNRKGFDIYSVVNSGVAIPGYPDPPGSGLDCQCSMAPSADPYVVGYYSYSIPGVISPASSNVRLFRVSNNTQVAVFPGPFTLEALTGAVTLLTDP